jgi:outer membrane protein TolC
LGVKIASIQKSVEEMNYDITKRSVRLEVEKAFYNILITEKVAQIAQKSFDQDTAHLRLVEEKFKNGISSEFEALRMRVEAKRAKSDLENALLSNRMSRMGLFLIMNKDFESDAQFTGDFMKPLPFLPLDTTLVLARQKRLELKVIDKSLQVLKNLVRLYQSNYLPVIGIQGAFQHTYGSNSIGDFFKFDEFGKDYTVGIGLSWTLFDGLNRTFKVAESKRDYEKLMIQSEAIVKGIDAEIRSAYWSLGQAEIDYNSALSSLEESDKLQKIANAQFESGLITFVELNDAELAVSATQLQFYKSLYTYNTALAKFNKATGN